MQISINKSLYKFILFLSIIFSMFIITFHSYTDEPALPKGLSSSENTTSPQLKDKNEPDLPQGLQSQPTNEPQLPQGLGEIAIKEEKKEENKQKKPTP
ncbi:MAG: hypothetical protein ACP5KS_12030, partial [Candidatus Hydrogenedens sp.]